MKCTVGLILAATLLWELGTAANAAQSAADQALLAKAIKACNGPQYPSGARPVVNYSRGTFQCVEPGSTRR